MERNRFIMELQILTNVFCSVPFERVLVLLLEYLQNYEVLVDLNRARN